jgi:hypothetical protein
VGWAVEIHPEVAKWIQSLDQKEYESVIASLDALEIDGPNLGRPFVDHIKTSKHKNMKELRPRCQHLRILFIFDPLRRAVLLVSGDKTNEWNSWYKKNIPVADKRYDMHLNKLIKGSK